MATSTSANPVLSSHPPLSYQEIENGVPLQNGHHNPNVKAVEEEVGDPFLFSIESLGKPIFSPKQFQYKVEWLRDLEEDESKKSEYIKLLFEAILSSKGQKNNIKIGRIASRAISILHALGTVSFEGLDLSGVELPKAHLPGANFFGSDLSRVNFEGANLEGASFLDTLLDSTNLKSSTLTRANFSDTSATSILTNDETKLTEAIFNRSVLTNDQATLFKQKGAILSLQSSFTFSRIETVAVTSQRDIFAVASKCAKKNDQLKVDFRKLNTSVLLDSLYLDMCQEPSFKPSMALSPKGTLFACSAMPNTISICNFYNEKNRWKRTEIQKYKFEEGTIEKLLFSDDDNFLIITLKTRDNLKKRDDFSIIAFKIEGEENEGNMILNQWLVLSINENVTFVFTSKENVLFCCTNTRYFSLDLKKATPSKEYPLKEEEIFEFNRGEIFEREFTPLIYKDDFFHFILPSKAGLFDFKKTSIVKIYDKSSNEKSKNVTRFEKSKNVTRFERTRDLNPKNVKWCQISTDGTSLYWVETQSNLLFRASLKDSAFRNGPPQQLEKQVSKSDKFFSNDKFMIHQKDYTLHIKRLIPIRNEVPLLKAK